MHLSILLHLLCAVSTFSLKLNSCQEQSKYTYEYHEIEKCANKIEEYSEKRRKRFFFNVMITYSFYGLLGFSSRQRPLRFSFKLLYVDYYCKSYNNIIKCPSGVYVLNYTRFSFKKFIISDK